MREAIITSTVLILCIMLLRRLCRRKISARLQYMLWLIVAIRLIMPGITAIWPNLLPESMYSVLNVADQMERAAQEYMAPPEQPVQGSLPPDGLPFLTEERPDGRVVTYLTDQRMWLMLLKKIWYLGMAAMGMWMTAVNIRFMRKLYGSRRRYEKEGFRLPVYTVKALSSPCLYGAPGRQAVYLPEDMAEDENKVRHILAHEYCHYKQKDVFWSALRCILLIAYWFHPLVWLAAVLSKQDCELACDEAAVRMLGEEERIAYGKTLVSLITRRTKAADIVCTATTMTADSKGIKERIRRVAESPRRLAFAAAPLILAVTAVVVLTFTQSKDYPEGVQFLEKDDSMTVTAGCFQITFPDSFAEKVYYREENDTDIIVYHKDFGLEVGRFCRMFYEEAVQLAVIEGKEVILIGNYGANVSLNNDMEGRGNNTEATVTYHGYTTAGESQTTDRSQTENESQTTGVGQTESGSQAAGVDQTSGEGSAAGVPGTDSNEAVTYVLSEAENAGGTAAWKASGGADPIPAPELVESEVIYLPYEENEEYSAVTVEDETEYLIVDNDEQETEGHEPSSYETNGTTEDSVVYLPTEQITEIVLSAKQPCYLYIPADYAEADAAVIEELTEMNRSLAELADSVIVLYMSRESVEEALNVLVENRTPYVGDNVRVSHIAASLPAAEGQSYQFLELKTTAEPYAITLHYRLETGNSIQTDSDITFLEAALLFSAVENLETCNIRIYDLGGTKEERNIDPSKMRSETIIYERKDLEEIFGALYPCSESKETITELYNRVLEYLEDEKILTSE